MRRYRMRLRRPGFSGVRTPVERPSQSSRRLLLLGLASAALAVPVWYWTTQTVDGQRVADIVLYGRVLAGSGARSAASDTLATVSLASAAVVAVGLAALGFVRGGLGLATAVFVFVTGANVTSQLLKEVLERPNLLGRAAYAVGNSFPSGHVTLVASLGLACILVAPRSLRTPVSIVVALMLAAVGVSTIMAGWHRLADVIGGILIALAWASIVTAALVRAQGWMPRRTWGRGRGGSVTTLAGIAGSIVIVAGTVALAFTALDPTALGEAVERGTLSPPSFAAALVVALGSAVVACAGFVWALRGVAVESPG
jgi:membrane-associated phospholipid phosphatase